MRYIRVISAFIYKTSFLLKLNLYKTPTGLQHMQQQYPYPSNQSGGDSLAVSGSHHHPGHEVEENSGSLEKQPVLPSASFSPPSVADQAASQAAAAAAAEAGGEEHHYSGTFPNLSS